MIEFCEVVGIVSIIQTAQTDQFMVIGGLVTVWHLDDDFLLTIPQDIDSIFGSQEDVPATANLFDRRFYYICVDISVIKP